MGQRSNQLSDLARAWYFLLFIDIMLFFFFIASRYINKIYNYLVLGVILKFPIIENDLAFTTDISHPRFQSTHVPHPLSQPSYIVI